MGALYLEDLITSFSRGCESSDCKNTLEWLGAKCHPGSSIKIEFTNNIMNLFCNICEEYIASIYYNSVTGNKHIAIYPSKHINILIEDISECSTNTCNPSMGFAVKFHNQRLELFCHNCKTFTGSVTITKKGSL